MEEKPERNVLSRSLSGITDIFSKKQNKETLVALPPIAPLEAKADITDTWEAVERFPSCLLVTDAILSNESKNYTVKEVIFNITSNDQGWCNEDNFEGIYEGSWTWFEVAILRPVKEGVRISPRDKQSINSEPFIKKFLEEQKISNRLSFVINPNEGIPFWHLQRNRRGNSEPCPHTITWTQDCKESESESLGWDFNAKDGSGSGVKFVSSLQRGDRVLVIARAKQSGSVNYISEAKVQINFEGFEDAPTPSLTQTINSGQSGTLANTMTAPGNPVLGERRTSNSTLQSSIAKPTEPDVRQQYLDVPRPTASPRPSSPISNNANPELPRATSFDAARAQAADTSRTGVDGGTGAPPQASNASTEVTRPAVPSDARDTGPSDAGPPVPPKTPAKQNRKGSNGNSRWNRISIPGLKKKLTSNKADSTTGNVTEARSEITVGTPAPIVNVPAGPPPLAKSSAGTESNTLTSPASPVTQKSKSFLGGMGDKINFRKK